MARQEITGAAPATALTSTMTASTPGAGATFTVTTGTGYPTGLYTGGFVVVVDRGTASEEKVLCSARSGNTFTVATSGRGYDGTTAASHGGGVTTGTVEESISAALLTDLSGHVYDTTRDDHTQYQKSSLLTTAGDLPYATGASTWARLGIGTAFQMLGTNSGATAPSWQASAASTLTTQADTLYAASANTLARLAKGTAYQAYIMNSGATAPSWASSLQSLMTTTGDIVYASAANTPARLAAGTSGYVLTSGGAGVAPSWAAAGSGAVTQIAQTILGSPAASVDFTSIAATYRDLMIVVSGASSDTGSTDVVRMRFNNDSGSNYYSEIVSGAGATAAASQESGTSSIYVMGIAAQSDSATTAGGGTIMIPNYRGTTLRKASTGHGGYGNGLHKSTSGLWFVAPAAINRVTLFLTTGPNFVTGTVVTLYGIGT